MPNLTEVVNEEKRQQIGWYCPGNKRFCYLDEKGRRKDSDDFIVPVFIDLEYETEEE